MLEIRMRNFIEVFTKLLVKQNENKKIDFL